MKVKVEAATGSSLIAIASLVSEIWLSTDRQIEAQTHTQRPLGLVYVSLFKVFMTLKTNESGARLRVAAAQNRK